MDELRAHRPRIGTRPLAPGEAEALAPPHLRPRPRPGQAFQGCLLRRLHRRDCGRALGSPAGAKVGAQAARSGDPVLVRVTHGLCSVAGAGLVEDPVDVGLDRRDADEERLGDLGVGSPRCDQLEHLRLAGRQAVR